MNEMDEFKQVFFIEAAELMAEMEERLMKLDEGSQDIDQLNAIFRCAHSIKGGSGAFGLNTIMRFTHKLEALLDLMRSGALIPSRASIDALLKSVDIVNQMLAAAQENRTTPDGFGDDVVMQLEAFAGGGAAPAAAMAAPIAVAAPVAMQPNFRYEITLKPHKHLLATGNEPLLLLRELAKLGHVTTTADFSAIPPVAQLDPLQCYLSWQIELLSPEAHETVQEVFEFVADEADITIAQHATAPLMDAATATAGVMDISPAPAVDTQAPGATAAPAKAAGASSPAVTSSIRVDIEKIDRLVNMVGELVITEAMLRAQTRHLPEESNAALMRGMEELSHHTRELQEAVMAVRMQPVKSIFSRMPRIVRDTAAQLGKDVQLILSGEHTEVDKTVIELLGDPLTHMIRNSVDHGIEMPDQRAWNDKPLQGTIHLSAYHRSGRIIIEITDDGAGINRTRVLNKAIEKGLVAADAQLTDEEIDHLIFLPGFSTAEQVTSVSGRGVGMDVVRKNIESLGGSVRITNQPGKGSVFTVSLPLTLAILDGMIVGTGDETYIVPISNIIETMRPKISDVHKVQGRADVMNIRGEFIPLVYLHQIFQVKTANTKLEECLIVLVESGTLKMGLVVNSLLGQQQVVIKSLEANADPVKGISGATILGDGKVSLILEINELWGLSQQASQTSRRAA